MSFNMLINYIVGWLIQAKRWRLRLDIQLSHFGLQKLTTRSEDWEWTGHWCKNYVDVNWRIFATLRRSWPFWSSICTIMAVSEERWLFSKQLQRHQIESWNDFADVLIWDSELPISDRTLLQCTIFFHRNHGLAREGHRVLECCDSRRVYNQCNAVLDFPRWGLRVS